MTYTVHLGIVYIIGAGPGDPDLITIRGRDVIAQANLLLCGDSLVEEKVPQFARNSAARIVGCSDLHLEQMLALIVESAQGGQVVAWLHSGAPTLHGALYDHMAYLTGYNIPIELIPGVPSTFADPGGAAGPQDRLGSSGASGALAQTYPITLTNLRGAPVVVVGGGGVAARKVRGLLTVGAAVLLISPDATAELRELASSGAIQWRPRPFQPGDLAGARLVFTATNQRAVNAQVAAEAAALDLLCNIADDPLGCDFHLPAVYREPGLLVAVSTEGANPARAKRLRDRIVAWLATSCTAQEEL